MVQSLLDATLAAAKRDEALVRSDGTPYRRLTQDVVIRRLITHVDDRGSLTELYDPRWGVHDEPLVFSYMLSIRPKVAKGWNLHREHEDRYCLLQGEMALVLYDVRPGSTTEASSAGSCCMSATAASSPSRETFGTRTTTLATGTWSS